MFHWAVLIVALTAHADCGSGRTESRDAAPRISSPPQGPPASTRHTVSYYVCSSSLRRPHRFASGEDELSKFRRDGSRVGFARTWTEGVASGWNAGWVDIRSGRE